MMVLLKENLWADVETASGVLIPDAGTEGGIEAAAW